MGLILQQVLLCDGVMVMVGTLILIYVIFMFGLLLNAAFKQDLF